MGGVVVVGVVVVVVVVVSFGASDLGRVSAQGSLTHMPHALRQLVPMCVL